MALELDYNDKGMALGLDFDMSNLPQPAPTTQSWTSGSDTWGTGSLPSEMNNAPLQGLGSFQGYQPRTKFDGSSFSGIGSGAGQMIGGPVGGAVGGLAGGAVDMYLKYQESKKRERAERARLEEARRQQIAARRREDRDRRLDNQRYEDKFGLTMNKEARVQEDFDFDMKQKRANMLRSAMINSINDNQEMRDIFAKRGVI